MRSGRYSTAIAFFAEAPWSSDLLWHRRNSATCSEVDLWRRHTRWGCSALATIAILSALSTISNCIAIRIARELAACRFEGHFGHEHGAHDAMAEEFMRQMSRQPAQMHRPMVPSRMACVGRPDKRCLATLLKYARILSDGSARQGRQRVWQHAYHKDGHCTHARSAEPGCLAGRLRGSYGCCICRGLGRARANLARRIDGPRSFSDRRRK